MLKSEDRVVGLLVRLSSPRIPITQAWSGCPCLQIEGSIGVIVAFDNMFTRVKFLNCECEVQRQHGLCWNAMKSELEDYLEKYVPPPEFKPISRFKRIMTL